MSVRTHFRAFLTSVLLCAGALLLAPVGCSAGTVTGKSGRTFGSGGASSSTGGQGSGAVIGTTAGTGAGSIVVPPTPDAGGTCVPIPCTVAGAQYCGTVGNGCNGTVDCGGCQQADWTCENSVCVGGASCAPATCTPVGATYCGDVGDGCGRKLACGNCMGQATCTGNVCVQPGCVPLTCTTKAGQYCGRVGDGCGGILDCGNCAGGATCGGGGIAHVCGGDPNCTPGACVAQGGGVYCDRIGDGCGGIKDCGACAGGVVCGGAGVANLCPGTGGPVCTGRQCDIAQCAAGTSTVVTGTIRDPAGINPIYNAVVYVPNTALDPIPTGASCDQCGATASGHPIAATLSDTQGRFRLENVPTGTNIPLVIQVGKWRREITIPTVTSCVETAITDANLTRLPRTQAEGHIPLMALTTGGSDSLECLLRRIGIADSEFTTDTGTGRVHLFVGGVPAANGAGQGTNRFNAGVNGGVAFPFAATTLWSNPTKMQGYDLMLFSCEGGQNPNSKQASLPNIEAYMNAGGRLFLSHLHFYWLRNGSAALRGTGNYIGSGPNLADATPATIDTTFPKGNALADWLVAVGATPTRGRLDIYQGQHSVSGVVAPTQRWIYVPNDPENNQPSIQYMTFNTPVGTPAANQCGRTVLTDLHMNVSVGTTGGDNSDPTRPFPTECSAKPASPQSKALEFLFFDLSSCIQPDTAQPQPPVPPPLPGSPAPPPPPPPPPR